MTCSFYDSVAFSVKIYKLCSRFHYALFLKDQSISHCFYRKKVNQNQHTFLFDKVPAFLIVKIRFIPLDH